MEGYSFKSHLSPLHLYIITFLIHIIDFLTNTFFSQACSTFSFEKCFCISHLFALNAAVGYRAIFDACAAVGHIFIFQL